MRSAASSASVTVASSISTANSSPPSRRTVSERRTPGTNPVAVTHADLEVRGRSAVAAHVGEEHLEEGDLVGMDEAQHVDVAELVGPVAENIAHRGAHVLEPTGAAHDADDVGDVLDHRLQS